MTSISKQPKATEQEKLDSAGAPPAQARGIEMIAVQDTAVPLSDRQAQRPDASSSHNQNNLG